MGDHKEESLPSKKARIGGPQDTAAAKLHGKMMLSPKPPKFDEAGLAKLTNNYDETNLIGQTQFGKLYCGKRSSDVTGAEAQDVVVKIWDEEKHDVYFGADYDLMFNDEVKFLRDPGVNYHPNLVKLIGYCPGYVVKGVVYALNPMDTLHNLTTKEYYTWPQRIKTVVSFARLLEFLHGQAEPYLVLNIDAAHIMLDKGWNPILLDFSLMSGGVLGERGEEKKQIAMSIGYVDPFLARTGYWWLACSDVYSFGVLLLGIIGKRMVEKEDMSNMSIPLIDDWAKGEYKDGCSLVHKSLVEGAYFDESDGITITALGMQCIGDDPCKRPTMKEVVERLQSLRVVQDHSDVVGSFVKLEPRCDDLEMHKLTVR